LVDASVRSADGGCADALKSLGGSSESDTSQRRGYKICFYLALFV